MAHAEELRLTVSVDDQATAQLQGLRGQLSSMGGGAQAAGMERVRRQSVEVGQGFAGLSKELTGFATRAGVIGGIVGAISSKLIELGSNFLSRATDVKGYSDAIVTLNRNATLSGVSMAQFQSMTTTMQQSGLSFEEATATANKYGEALVDLQRVNSPTRRRLIAEAPDAESQRNMTILLDRMRESSPPVAANMWLDAAAGVRKYWEARGQGAKGAQDERRMLAEVNLPYMGERRFRVPTQEEQGLIDARLPAAKAYREESEATATAYERIVKSASAIYVDTLNTGPSMGLIRTTMEAAATAAEKLEDRLRKANEAANKAAPAPGTTGAKGDEWWRAYNPFDPRNIARERAVAPELTPGLPPALQPQPPTSRQTEQERQLREFNERERQRLEEEDRQRRELQPPTGPTRPSAPVARPAGAAAPSRFPQQPAPAPETPPVPEASAVMDEAAKAAAAEAARRATAEAADAARQAAAVERRRQAARGWAGTAPPPTAPPAATPQPAPSATLQFMGGPQPLSLSQPTLQPQPTPPARPEPQAVEGRAYDVPVIGDLLKAIAGGGITVPSPDFAGTGWRGLPISRNVVDERGQPPATPPAITVTPPSVVVSPPPQPIVVPFNDRFGDWPQQPQPQPATVEPSRGRELEGIDTGRAPPPSAFEGGRIGMMGGAGMDLGQAGQALDARVLDRAAARDVNVNGSGKISVDVRAPAGTHVAAQGQGLFKTVTIARQTQMFPAESGPIPETGIGAAQGQLGG